MQHYFLHNGSISCERWLSAFPGARVLTDASIDPGGLESGSCIWLLTHIDAWMKKAAAFQRLGHRVMILTLSESIEEGRRALGSGASAYLHALAAPEVLRNACSTADNGGVWIGAALMRAMVTVMPATAPPVAEKPDLSALTPREKEVAFAAASGANNKEIAAQFELGERTVKAHLTNCFKKLSVRDRVQLALLLKGSETEQVL